MFDMGSGRNLLGTVVVALLAAGCGGTAAPPPTLGGDASQALTITIRNEQIDAARITLWVNSARRRLGDVRGNSTETFQVPMPVSASVRMEFDLTLGASCVTRDVFLAPGDVIDVTIPVDLRMMQAVCRGGP